MGKSIARFIANMGVAAGVRLFEYRAKELFKKYGLPVLPSRLAHSPSEVASAFAELPHPVILKAQVLVGGRGKAGGVVSVSDSGQAQSEAARIFELSIGGEKPSSILVEASFPHSREMYLAVALDRGQRSFVVIAAAEGGMEVESLPGKVVRLLPLSGIDARFADEVAAGLGLGGQEAEQFAQTLTKLEKLARETESELAEINPLAVGADGKLLPLDAKVILDDSALFRHPEFSRLHPEDEFEGEASREGFAFVRLDGDLAVVGNGAGLVLSTLDMVGDAGGRPACFLDLGGGAQKDRVKAALRLVNRLPTTTRILVNIFGGITRTTDVAEGIKEVLSEGTFKPLYARVSGTEEEQARVLLESTPVKLYGTAQEAVDSAVGAK